MLFHNDLSLPLPKYLIRPDLKIVGLPPPGSVFPSIPGRSEKNFFNHFEMEKIALILISNTFVTKKIFSGINIKKFFYPHVSCRSGRVMTNQHIFKSGLSWAFYLKTYFTEMHENDHSQFVQYSNIILCYITINYQNLCIYLVEQPLSTIHQVRTPKFSEKLTFRTS